MKWIKASERMPGWDVKSKWRMSPEDSIQISTVKEMMGWASMFLTKLEWLDESPSPLNTLREALERIAKPMKVSEYDGTAMFPELVRECKERVQIAREALSSPSLPVKDKGEERRLHRQEDNNEHLGKCLNMLKYLYMNEYCGDHADEVRQLIMPRPQPKV